MRTIFLLMALALPVVADTEFRAGRMTRGDVPLGKGQCDIRLRIDDEGEVRVRGDRVWVRTVSGRDARDDGSQCNQPLPDRGIQAFRFEVLNGRGDIFLLSPPYAGNGYTAAVRIRDSSGGSGRYLFRLSWTMDGHGATRADAVVDTPSGARQALEVCERAVISRIVDEYQYGDVSIRNIRADDSPGRRDHVFGEAGARRGFRKAGFAFVCAVDLDSGRVRSVDVRKH